MDPFEKSIRLYNCSCQVGCQLNPEGALALFLMCVGIIGVIVFIGGRVKRRLK
jgi:hypothetical protein